MKILHINRKENLWVGGDWIKLRKVTEELRKLRHEVDIWELQTVGMDEWNGIEAYDIVHIWNFSMPWAKYGVWLAGKHKKKIVASMIYHDTDAFIPYNFQQIMMDHMDACIYETENEVWRVKHHLTPKNTYIVGNGVDSSWFEPDDTKVPFKGYLLTVGRIEPNKGQLEAAHAARDLGLTYICIGGSVEKEYTDKVLAQGAIIYPPMEQEKLKRWYKNCAVYIQPSKNETWGMAVDEAGTQGVPIVISTGFEREDIPEVIYCEHGNIESITKAIQQGISQKRNTKFQQKLKKNTWKAVAAAYDKIYKEICVNSQ